MKNQQWGKLFPRGALLTSEEASFSTEPDATFASWETLESERLRYVPLNGDVRRSKELLGTPDWVLEIISDASAARDAQLRQLYFRAGIPESWLVDARGTELAFTILVLDSAAYEPADVRRGGWQASPVFKRLFRLSRTKNRLDHWEYRLQIKPLR